MPECTIHNQNGTCDYCMRNKKMPLMLYQILHQKHSLFPMCCLGRKKGKGQKGIKDVELSGCMYVKKGGQKLILFVTMMQSSFYYPDL